MEQVIILLLLFALPGLIKKLTGGQKKAAPAPRERKRTERRTQRRSTAVEESLEAMDEQVQVKEPGSAPEDIPAWLRKLSEGLGEVQQQKRQAASPSTIESMDVSPMEEQLHGNMVASERELGRDHRVMPSEHLPEQSMEHRVAPSKHLQTASSDLRGVSDAGTTSVADVHWRGKKRSRMSLKARPGKSGWRKAIMLAEIIGPPRALNEFRAVGERET